MQDLRAYEQGWLSRLLVSSLHTHAQDPLSSGHTGKRNLGVTASILYGRVVDGVAYTGCYKVFFENGRPPMPCVLGAKASFLPYGTRSMTSLGVGDNVWVITHQQLDYGIIFIVEPGPMTDPTLAKSDFIHQASRCGLRVDGVHHAIARLNRAGGFTDWSGGRPFDGTLGGEWGAISSTGIKVTLDDYMAQIGVDELSGLAVFYHDQLTRLGGYNLQIFTSGSEEETLDDQGEIMRYRGITLYPWEQAGAVAPGTDPFRVLSAQESQIDAPYYSMIEPQNDDQQPIHRKIELDGYIGQGGKRMILLPQQSGDLSRYGSTTHLEGVFEEQVALTGAYTIRSAKGITIAKRPAIPAPRRIVRPEDPSGDNPDNYRPGGFGKGGEEHLVQGQITPSSKHPGLQQMAAISDTLAHSFSWEGAHALHYHELDWDFPQPSDTTLGKGSAPTPYGNLASAFYIEPPNPVNLHVDHRYGNVPYFLNDSFIKLTDDGGISISDGYGAEIRMVGGHLILAAPGDIWVQPGRNFNVLSGFDTCIRAKNSIDLSATNHDVRIKAEGNFQVLAGNGGIGGILLESKAPSIYDYVGRTGEDVITGGIQFKATTGDVVAWGSNIYLRTGGGTIPAGSITLDAGKGTQEVNVYAASVLRYITGAAADYFGPPDAIAATNIFSATSNLLDSSLTVNGTVFNLKGGAIFNGNVDIVDGHIGTQLAPQYDNLVGTVTGVGLAEIQRDIQQANDILAKAISDGQKFWKQVFQKFLYGDTRAGNDDVINSAGFSFRTGDQYHTKDFALFETRWQQLARISGNATATWTEKPVVSGSTKTYPYPGRKAWADNATLFEQDLILFDAVKNVDKDRSAEIYGEPKFAKPRSVTPDGNYTVIL